MAKIPLTVVILAKNEEAVIGACCESVFGWVDEILVVDDTSSDHTVDIVKRYTSRVYTQAMLNEGRHRNWGYALAQNDWVLSLDADERVSEGLRDEMCSGLFKTGTEKAWAIPIKTYIGDYWVRYAGWYPASKIRLFDKNFFRYEEAEVHPRAFVDGPVGELRQAIIHLGYPDFEHFLASLNRQTTLEARKWARTGVNMPLGRAVRRTLDRFMRSYFRKRGYKDGFMGFMVAFFAALYQLMSYAKYWQIKKNEINHERL